MARKFAGGTDNITIAYSKLPPPATICAWSLSTSFPVSNTSWIFGTNPNSGAGANGFYVNSGGHIDAFATTTLNQNGERLGAITVTTSVWNHWARTFDNGTLKLIPYVNGIADGSVSLTGTLIDTGSPYVIGKDPFTGNTNPLIGLAADCAAWSVVLTPQEIYALAKGVLRPWQVRPAALIKYLPLDGYLHPALDRSPFADEGVLSGTTLAPGPPLLSTAPIFPGVPIPGAFVTIPPPPLMGQIIW
jgi:hypothetical protein